MVDIRKTLSLSACCLLLACGSDRPHDASDELLLGHIDFPTSGAADAQRQFIQGVLALHSFWYPEARDRFRRAQELDPGFGMAYWGEAMTFDNALGVMQDHADDHPLQHLSDHADERMGAEVVQRMDELDAMGALRWTERERAYAEAVRARFRAGSSTAERRQRHFEAMRGVARSYPEDDEAMVFAALAMMALPGFDIEQPEHVVAVAGRLEEVYERNPDHPGVLHYLIHAYDTQTFALMGLRQARRYARIAPASSHALHMPSHIFRHLGMWEEVAASNEAAYATSVEWQQRTGRPLHMRDYHALDWLLSAHLVLGQLADAEAVMAELEAIEAEIADRGEEARHVPQFAAQMRAYYEEAIAR